MSVHIVQRLKQSVTLRTLYVRVTIHSPVLMYGLFCLIYTWYTFRIKRWLRQLCVDTLLQSYCRTYWISKLTQYYYMVSEVRVTFNDGFTGVPTPKMDWEASNLPEQWEKIPHTRWSHIQRTAGGEKRRDQGYLFTVMALWVGDKGREIYTIWTGMTNDEKKKLEPHD